MTKIRKVAIVGGSRIPFVRSNTTYSDASNMDMLAQCRSRSLSGVHVECQGLANYEQVLID